MAVSVQDQLDRVRDKVRKTVGAIEADERDVAQYERLAAEVDPELDACAVAEAAGELTADQVSRRLDDLEAKRRRHQSAAEQRRRVIDVRRREITELEREVAMIPYRAAVEAYEATTRTHERRAGEFARTLAPAVKAATALARARSASQEAYEEAERLRPADVELPAIVDEPEWPDTAELRTLLADGHVAPAAKAARVAAEADRRHEATEQRMFNDAVEELACHINWGRAQDVETLGGPRFGSISAGRHEELLTAVATRRTELEREWAEKNPAAAAREKQRREHEAAAQRSADADIDLVDADDAAVVESIFVAAEA